MKPKRPGAIWKQAFPDQALKLRPERSKAGGVKARSGSEARRMEVYNPIAAIFKESNPQCQACRPLGMLEPKNGYRKIGPGKTEHVHHVRGRAGLYLFDMKYFKAVCAKCHLWIHDHPQQAMELGLIERRETNE